MSEIRACLCEALILPTVLNLLKDDLIKIKSVDHVQGSTQYCIIFNGSYPYVEKELRKKFGSDINFGESRF